MDIAQSSFTEIWMWIQIPNEQAGGDGSKGKFPKSFPLKREPSLSGWHGRKRLRVIIYNHDNATNIVYSLFLFIESDQD